MLLSVYMAKKHKIQEIKQNLIDVLSNSKLGLTGVEISNKLGISRITMTKYLNIFATEGLIKQKIIGSANLWSIEKGIEQFCFPNDYFKIKNKYFEHLLIFSEEYTSNLIKSSLYFGANTTKIILEIIIPAIKYVRSLYSDGKIVKFEEKLLNRIILTSIRTINFMSYDPNPKKNILIISTDVDILHVEAVSASFNSNNWSVIFLGDVSDTIDILFDLDLQKFLTKIWKNNGILIILIFAESEKKLKFFSDVMNSTKDKFGKNIHLILFSDKKTNIGAGLVTNDFNILFQWSETKFESLID